MQTLRNSFLRSVHLRRETIESFDSYPFTIPAIRTLETLELDSKVTGILGENGSGKSTLVEAIAVAAGFNPEGGSRNFAFATRSSESELWRYLRLVRGIRKPRTGYFFPSFERRASSMWRPRSRTWIAKAAVPRPSIPTVQGVKGLGKLAMDLQLSAIQGALGGEKSQPQELFTRKGTELVAARS